MFLQVVFAAVLAFASAAYDSKEFCSPIALRYGDYKPRKTIFKKGETITYICGNNYELHGEAVATCLGSDWDYDYPYCKRIPKCPKPPHLHHGYYMPYTEESYYSVGSVITYICHDHYQISGYSQLTCLSTGKWDYGYSKCLTTKCDPPSAYDHLYYAPLHHEYHAGNQVTYHCEHGYTAYGNGVSTCEVGGSWTKVSLKCRKICLPPAQPQGGTYSPRYAIYRPGQYITYSCHNNLILRGPKTVACSHHGSWPAKLPYCDTPKCYPPSKPDKGIFFPFKDYYLPGETVYFTCGTHYVLKGATELQCRDSGYWNGSPPKCLEPFCKRPRKPRFGYFGPVKSTYKKDEAVWFACKKPYILIGQKDIHCLQGGLWSFKEPICSLPQCSADELHIDYGYYYPKPYPVLYPVGIKVHFYCSDHYALNGPSTITCNQGGHWSQQPPTCELGCLRPPFPKYGHITPIKKAYAIGEQLWYKCLPGRRPYPEADIVCLGRNYWSVPEVKCVTEESCKTKTVCGKVLPGRSCQCEAKFCAQYPHQCCSDFKEYCFLNY